MSVKSNQLEPQQPILSKDWLLLVGVAMSFSAVAIAGNELILRSAGHRPSLVSDADLWCLERDRLSTSNSDLLLLGASRMQTDIDLETVAKQFSKNKVLQLAMSGKGTSYPAFRDIVENTEFAGTIFIDETEDTLASDKLDQEKFVQHFENVWSLDKRLNRELATLWQSHFVFCNPNSNSMRLWGNLVWERTLPEPFHIRTLISRQQLSDFSDGEVVARVNSLRDSGIGRINEHEVQHSIPPKQWLDKVLARWAPLVKQFQSRGGRIVFIRLPVSPARMARESQLWPVDDYWRPAMSELGAIAIHSFEHTTLCDFEFPDSSHLDYRQSPQFTAQLLRIIEAALRDSHSDSASNTSL